MPIRIDLNSFDILSISEMCEVCFLFEKGILTYLQDVILRECPRGQRRLTKCISPTFWCLYEIRNLERRQSSEADRRITFEQFYATTKIKTRRRGLIVEEIEPLFNVFVLEAHSLRTVTTKQLLHVFIAIMYKILIAMSDKALAMPADVSSLRISSLVKKCITTSIKMRQKLKLIFAPQLNRRNCERDIHNLSVELTIG